MSLQKPIAIDRSKPREAAKSLLVQGKARLQEGLSVVIFPEGTRSKPGTVKSFSKGGAMLAVNANTPALPIIHNAGDCWPVGTMLKSPGVIRVQIGAPIQVEGKTSVQVMEEYSEWVQDNIFVISG